jgi:Lectin C-type domain
VARTRGSSLPDAGAVDTLGGRGPPDASPSVDAAPSPNPRLTCRDECVCESGVLGEFMFCSTAVSHDDAVAACSLAGGGLASVDDPTLNERLTARMAALEADDFWLSGTDLDDEGVWRWSDGRVFFDVGADAGAPRLYAPWDEEQPNDLNGEDCMRSTGGVWRDLDCSAEIAFVCQG